MAKCNYHILQNTYEMLEQQLKDAVQKMEEMKLNVDIENINVNLGNLETQLQSIEEAISALQLIVDTESLDTDLQAIKGELQVIAAQDVVSELTALIDALEPLDVNLTTNTLQETLSDIKDSIETLKTNLDSNINFNVIESRIDKISNQLEISNKLNLLSMAGDIDGVLSEEARQQYLSILKNELFGVDNESETSSQDEVTPSKRTITVKVTDENDVAISGVAILLDGATSSSYITSSNGICMINSVTDGYHTVRVGNNHYYTYNGEINVSADSDSFVFTLVSK